MHDDRRTEVLVVGGGPVGLLAALSLAERGLEVRVIEKYHRTALHSYALALHPGTLRLLDRLGLAAELLDLGRPVERIALHHDDESPVELDFAGEPGQFSFVLVLPQVLLEGALEARLEDMGVDVSWGQTALSFDEGSDGIETLIAETHESATAAGTDAWQVSAQRVRSAFVIGADGGASTVRKWTGIPFPEVGERTTYGLLEFAAAMPDTARSDLVFHEHGTDLLWPIGPQRGRWNIQLPDDRPADSGNLVSRLRSRAPWFDSEIERIHWVGSATFERRLVDHFGRGRIWLAGDAAHAVSPLGAQSMNVGLAEADDLARRLHGILRERGSLRDLDGYDTARRAEWRTLHGIDAEVRPLPSAEAWTAQLGALLPPALPASGEALTRLLRQAGLAFAAKSVRERDVVPAVAPPTVRSRP